MRPSYSPPLGAFAAALVFLIPLIPPMAFSSPTRPVSSAALQAPRAAQKEHQSHWHGETVTDPWFWLREKENPEVLAYLEAENAYANSQTHDVQAFAEVLYKEMLGRIQQTDLSVPYRLGDWSYYTRTEEGKQYQAHCRSPIAAAEAPGRMEEQVLLDLNALAAGHEYLGLDAFEVSDDSMQLFYSTDTTGFRQYKLYSKNLKSGETSGVLAERVTSVALATDSRTVFYTTEDETTKRSNQLWRLDLQAGKPELVYEEKDELYRLGVDRTRDKALIVMSCVSTDTWEQHVLPANTPEAAFRCLIPREKGHKYSVDHRNKLLYLRTNRGAKNFRVVTAPPETPSEANWKPFVEHDPKALLEDIQLFADHAVVQTKSEGLERMRVYDFDSGTWHALEFPEAVYTAHISPTPEYATHLLRFSYQSMVTPSSVYEYDMVAHERKLLKRQEVLGGYDPSRYVTERAWASARDGVRIPLSIVSKKGVREAGPGACFLYAYGSYGIGMPAHFSSSRLSLLDRGMVYVIAHVRGGDELGEEWHDHGMLMEKKNTFNDFIDSAEWLVREGWASKDRLVIQGESAGGLLMGAVANARPDLFKAVHAGVPFVDVINTMMDSSLPLTVGEYLEWGDPNEKPAFDYMRSYSPYDNLKAQAYPAMLVTTSLNDSQVMYWEPAKYVAKLRTLKTDSNPLHFRCNMEAGHGGASGRYDQLREEAFEYAWLMNQVGISR